MDKFVKNLTEELEKRNEKTVLVMYGDHLPALDMTEDELASGDLYKTEYIIWSNFRMKKEDKDLYSYQIGAEVLERLGIRYGNQWQNIHRITRTARHISRILRLLNMI